MILTEELEAQLLSAVRGSIILLTKAEMYHGEKNLTSHTYLKATGLHILSVIKCVPLLGTPLLSGYSMFLHHLNK